MENLVWVESNGNFEAKTDSITFQIYLNTISVFGNFYPTVTVKLLDNCSDAYIYSSAIESTSFSTVTEAKLWCNNHKSITAEYIRYVLEKDKCAVFPLRGRVMNVNSIRK